MPTAFAKMAPYYDAIYSLKDYRAESAQIAKVLRSRAKRRVRTLLDVGCGTGNHLVYLSKQFEAEGVDIDPAMLRAARRRLPGVRFHRADFTRFDLKRRYDAVVSLFGVIGYAVTRENMEKAVRAMAKHVEPGGVLLIDPWIRRGDFGKGRAGSITAKSGRETVVRGHRTYAHGPRSFLEFHYLIIGPDRVRHIEDTHVLGLFTDAQYRRAMERAGLKVSSLKKGPSGRGLYVGVKPLR